MSVLFSKTNKQQQQGTLEKSHLGLEKEIVSDSFNAAIFPWGSDVPQTALILNMYNSTIITTNQ